MASKTGAELKTMLHGDATHLEDGTAYPMALAGNLRVPVTFNYTIPDPVEPDDGNRQIGRVIELSVAEVAAGLTAAQRTALLNLVASKI